MRKDAIMSLSPASHFGSKTALKTILMLTCLAAPTWAFSVDDRTESTRYLPAYQIPRVPEGLDGQRSKSTSPPAEGASTPRRLLAAALRESHIVDTPFNWGTFISLLPNNEDFDCLRTTLAAVAILKAEKKKEIEFDTFYDKYTALTTNPNAELAESIFNLAPHGGLGWEIELLGNELERARERIQRQPNTSPNPALFQSRDAVTSQDDSSRSSSSNPILSPAISPALSPQQQPIVASTKHPKKKVLEQIESLLELLGIKQKGLEVSRKACKFPRQESGLEEGEQPSPQAAGTLLPRLLLPPAASDDTEPTLPRTACTSPRGAPTGGGLSSEDTGGESAEKPTGATPPRTTDDDTGGGLGPVKYKGLTGGGLAGAPTGGGLAGIPSGL